MTSPLYGKNNDITVSHNNECLYFYYFDTSSITVTSFKTSATNVRCCECKVHLMTEFCNIFNFNDLLLHYLQSRPCSNYSINTVVENGLGMI